MSKINLTFQEIILNFEFRPFLCYNLRFERFPKYKTTVYEFIT